MSDVIDKKEKNKQKIQAEKYIEIHTNKDI